MARFDDEFEEDEIPDCFPGVSAKAVSPKAVLCVFPEFGGDKGAEEWVPKSMIHDDSEVYDRGHFGKLLVKCWWTEKALESRKKAKALRKTVKTGG